jgi:hypothetical protein
VLRADVSSLGDFYLEVTAAGDGEAIELRLAAPEQAATVLVNLLHRAYYEPLDYEEHPEVEDRRGDAVYVRVGFVDNDQRRYQIVVFRVGDELRAASRMAQVDPGEWEVFQVIKLAPRAAIDPIHPDPH